MVTNGSINQVVTKPDRINFVSNLLILEHLILDVRIVLLHLLHGNSRHILRLGLPNIGLHRSHLAATHLLLRSTVHFI